MLLNGGVIIPNFRDLSGQRFGAWTVLKQAPNHISHSGSSYTAWECVCDCGCHRTVLTNALTSGRSSSCGCLGSQRQRATAKKNFTTHGESKTRLYKIWAGMRKRCRDQDNRNYGARGITVCDQWNDYMTFREWAATHGYDDTKSIDRIDVDGNYCSENCRWATSVAQANNRRSSVTYTINGITLTLAEWARKYNKPYKLLWKKLKAGKQLEDLLIA